VFEAQGFIERWRQEYNTVRPHRSRGYRPPGTGNHTAKMAKSTDALSLILVKLRGTAQVIKFLFLMISSELIREFIRTL